MIIAFISALSFYIFPTLVGRGLLGMLKKRSISYPFISYFIAGLALTYITILISFALSNIFSLHIPSTVILESALGILAFLFLPINLFMSRKDLRIKPYILPALVSATLASCVYAIWQFHSPYPFNWDMYEHQTLVNTILQGKISLIPSQITDTFGFDGYSTLFHTMIAASQVLLSPVIFQYWNAIAVVHFSLVIFASYLLTKEITDNKYIAFLSMLITTFVFDSSISFTTLFFIPQTFTAMLFIFLFAQMIKEVKSGKIPSVIFIILNSLFILVNHYIIGVIATGLYAGTYLYTRYLQVISERVNIKRTLEIIVFLAFIAVLFSSSISFGFLNGGEAQAFTLTLPEKFSVMRQSYGFLLLLALPIGVYVSLNKKKGTEILALIIMLGLVALVLTQLPYVMKFYVLARFFVDMFIAIGLYTLIKKIHNRVLICAVTVVLIGGLTAIFIVNAFMWKGILHYQNTLSHVSAQEVEAALFLKEHYGNSNALLVSDPATQNILEPLSNVNSQGGTYMKEDTRLLLDKISKSSNTSDVAATLYQINDKIAPTTGKRLLILSGRYFLWQESILSDKLALNYNIWYPAHVTLQDIEKIDFLLADSKHFHLVFENQTMAILEVAN